MRHALASPARSPLASGVQDSAPNRALVEGAGQAERQPPGFAATACRAVALAVIAPVADADLPPAALTPEQSIAVAHRAAFCPVHWTARPTSAIKEPGRLLT